MRHLKIALFGAALLLAPIAARAADTTDSWLTTKSKVAVLSAVGTTGTSVHIDTVDGLVTLHGTVASTADKAAAEKAVRNLDGVKKVRNLLEVVESKDQETVTASDADIEKSVKKALERDAVLKDETGIKVESVNKGTVLLGGKATTLSNHLRAVEDVRDVKGVRRVASTIESPDSKAVRDATLDESKLAKETESTTSSVTERVKSTSKGMSQTASDLYITSKAKTRLLTDSKTPGNSINVDTKDGVVTLFGTVTDQAAKTKAEEEVGKVDGVKKVRNEIEVVSASRKDEVADRDAEVERGLKKAVARDDALSNASISVEVRNGVARLTGTAPTEKARKEAEQIAKRMDGVRSVRNEIEVSSD